MKTSLTKNIIPVSILILMGITALLTRNFYYSVPKYDEIFTKRIPLKIKEWSGTEIPIEKRVLDILETDDAIIRTYKKINIPPVNLYIVFSKGNRKVAHPPEICSAGVGKKLINKQREVLNIEGQDVEIAHLVLVKEKEQVVLLYTYKSGSKYTDNVFKQQLYLVLDIILKKRSSGALITITTPVVESEKVAGERAKSFLRDLFPYIVKELP